MGAAMASRLLPAGYSVTVYGRTPSKAAPLLSFGGRLADSPFAVAQSSKWYLPWWDTHQMFDRLSFVSQGILAGLNPGGVQLWHARFSVWLRVMVLPGAALGKQLFRDGGQWEWTAWNSRANHCD